MEPEYNYDVFISYSRQDYVDENKNILPNNVVSQIKATLEENNLKYWIDEEGNLTGKKFAHIIAGKIRESLVFLFVCSKNSVASKWVDRELAVADEFDKHIIPFICDDSYKDDKVVMFTAALDRIEFFGNFNPIIELEKLVNAISKDKKDLEEKRKKEEEELEKRRQEEEKQKRLKEEAEKKEKTKEEITQLSSEYKLHSLQQEIILQQLHEKNAFIDNKKKKCPICGKEHSIKVGFCDKCGFQFPALYSIDGNETYLFDEHLLTISKANYNAIAQKVAESDRYRDEVHKLTLDNRQLKAEIDKISLERENLFQTINEKESEALFYRNEVAIAQKEFDGLDTENKQLKKTIDKITKESERHTKALKEKESETKALLAKNSELAKSERYYKEKADLIDTKKKDLEQQITTLKKELSEQTILYRQSEEKQKQLEIVYQESQESIKELVDKLSSATKVSSQQNHKRKKITRQEVTQLILDCRTDSCQALFPQDKTAATIRFDQLRDDLLAYGINLSFVEFCVYKTIEELKEAIFRKAGI